MNDSAIQFTIELNGEAMILESGCTVDQLLEQIIENRSQSGTGGSRAVAVELNSEIVPRDQFGLTILKDGDRVEVVTLVGGG